MDGIRKLVEEYEAARAVVVEEEEKCDGRAQRIAGWAMMHDLTYPETKRLMAVLVDYPEAEIDTELKEELRCIIADRKLAAMPELTMEVVDRAQEAFESGRIPFVRQDVD